MPTYIEIYDSVFSSPDVQKRLVIACQIGARDVVIEPTSTPNHDNRMLWVRAVIVNPTAVAVKMLPAIITDPVFQTGIFTDAALLTKVESVIDLFSTIV